METYRKSARLGPGRFQWNGGAWFGSQIGGTLWLLFAGAVLFTAHVPLALLVIGCFLLANAAGTFLWTRRDRLAPYAAIQVLILTLGLCGLVAALAMDAFGQLGALDERLVESPRLLYVALLIFPALMVWFHLLERVATKRQGEDGTEGLRD